jgi:ATP-dependent helicase/nuclease subunit A
MDINKSILFHPELGYGPDFVDPLRRISYPTVLKEALKKTIRIESLSEEMRVLYVAFTRAKEKLIITGSIRDIDRNLNRMSSALEESGDKLGEYEILKAKSYLDWIVPAVIRHIDGKALRELIKIEDTNVNLLNHPASFKVRFWNRDGVAKNASGEEETPLSTEEMLMALKEKPIQEEVLEEIERRLGFSYKYEMSTKIPTVITVTELKRKFNVELSDGDVGNMYGPRLIKKPKFLEEIKGLTPAEKGTAMHAVLQRLDLSKVESKGEIQKQIEVLIEKMLISVEEGKSVRVEKLMKLFKTELGQRMVKAHALNKLKREIPFHMEINSTDIDKNLPEDIYGEEKIILQGIIDCYFEENGKIILVDYKTDAVKDGDVDVLVQKYKSQLDYYARALNETLKTKVSESYLYLFSIDEATKVE